MPRISDLSQEALSALTDVKVAQLELSEANARGTRAFNKARERVYAALDRLALVLHVERMALLTLDDR